MPKGGKSSRRKKRLKDTLSEAPLPPEEEEMAEKPDFSNLPDAVVVSVLLKSSMEDVLRLCCCCQTFRKAAESESFWKQYCHHNWGHRTCPSQWLQSHPMTHIPSLPRLTDYKSLGMLLTQMESLIGFWSGSVKRPLGLFEFVWMPDCVACCDLMSSSGDNVLYIGPHYSIAGEIVDGCHCILRDYRHSALPSGCLTTAAAVASVAVGSVSDSSLSTGFETEMMRYMQSTVQSKRNRAHRRCHGSGVLPDIHHFTRLFIPAATKHTWMTGLWSRASREDTSEANRILEVIMVQYDFSGTKAQIFAKLVASSRPRDTVVWRVLARPTSSKWADGHLLKGTGCVWDEERHNFSSVTGFLVVSSENSISFYWPLDGATQPANGITYHRLRERGDSMTVYEEGS